MRGEVELQYVHTDQQVADIFTKPLGSDKLQHFTEMLGVQHLDVPHLRGRTGKDTGMGKGKEVLTKGETRRRKEPSRQRKLTHPNKSEQAATAAKSRRTELTGRRRPKPGHGPMW